MARKRVLTGLSPEAEEAFRQYSQKLASEDHAEEPPIGETREPTTTVFEIIGPENRQTYKDAAYGRSQREARRRGGSSLRTRERDIDLAREFKKRWASTTRLSKAALIARIADERKMPFTTARDAINRGLRHLT